MYIILQKQQPSTHVVLLLLYYYIYIYYSSSSSASSGPRTPIPYTRSRAHAKTGITTPGKRPAGFACDELRSESDCAGNRNLSIKLYVYVYCAPMHSASSLRRRQTRGPEIRQLFRQMLRVTARERDITTCLFVFCMMLTRCMSVSSEMRTQTLCRGRLGRPRAQPPFRRVQMRTI
jgi:hypothetical protein